MLAGNVELVVQASYTAGTFTHWLEAHPSVLLGKASMLGGGRGHARRGLPTLCS